MGEVDSLIKALSNHIKENIEKATPDEIAEMTKALAELVSARVSQN